MYLRCGQFIPHVLIHFIYIYISFREISSSTSCYVFFFFFFLFFFKTLARRSFLSLSLSVLLPFLSLSSIITHISTAHIYRYRSKICVYPGNMCARVNEREKPLCRSNNAKETFPFPSSLVSFRSFFPCFSEFFFSTFKLTRTLLLEGLYGVSCELTGISFNPPLRSPPPARTCRPACRISAPKHLDTRIRAARRQFLLVKNKCLILESQILISSVIL